MEQEEQLEKQQRERRDFLSCLGGAIACGAATVAASAASPVAAAPAAGAAMPPIPNFDWSKHNGHSASTLKNASAVCAALRRANGKTMFPLTPITFGPGSSAT